MGSVVLSSGRRDAREPFGPFVRGWSGVVATAAAAAGHYRDGEIIGFERVGTYASDELACIAEIERFRAKVGKARRWTPSPCE